MPTTIRVGPSVRRALPDLLALSLLLLLTAWYFLPHLLGRALFVGDSDRMSHFFTWLTHLNDGVRHGYLPTWNNSLFGGYSTVGLPYTYYNPSAFLGLLFSRELQNWVAGWTSMLWLWLAGVAAYALIRSTLPSAFFAFVGAALYQSSAVLMLKISQNEGTFSVTVLTPFLLLCLQAARPGRLLPWILAAAAGFTYLFTVSFLQEAAYACLLLGLFGAYRLIVHRQWSPVLVAAASSVPALLLSLPRLANVATELALSNRGGSPGLRETWLSLGAFNEFEILRLLDDRMLGRYFSHALALGNGINLHEGMVAYVSTFAVVVCGLGLVWYLATARREATWPRGDIPFHILFVTFCLSVPLAETAYGIMYHLFFKVGFIHARVTTVAMPSLCLLTAMFLYAFASRKGGRELPPVSTTSMLLTMLACVLTTLGLEALAQPYVDAGWPIVRNRAPRAVVSVGAALRTMASVVIAIGLLAGALWARSPRARGLMVRAVGLLAVLQLAVYAKDQTSGDFMYSPDLPYRTPTRLVARTDEFRIPSDVARAELQAVLQPELYRTALMCDPDRISIYCTPYMANVWGLREIGGYVSSIPLRVSALPWPPPQLGLRSVTLASARDANWGLLALLNVQYAVEYHPALLTNAVREEQGAVRELRPSDLTIHRNPVPVVPRVFFPRNVVAKSNVDEVVAALFHGRAYDPQTSDVRTTSYVEGPSAVQARYHADQEVQATFRDQYIDIRVAPSPHTRFLVVNERYHPEWRAYVDDAEADIFPTNVFMRGVVVPPKASRVRLQFEPFSLSRRALPLYAAGALLLLVVLAVAARRDRRERAPQPAKR